MDDFNLQRQIKGLKGDLNMTKMAVSIVQEDMKKQLNGDMGEDMMAVLNGERIVKAGIIEKNKHKIKTWLKNIFRIL